MSEMTEAMFEGIEWEILPPQEPGDIPYAVKHGFLTIMGKQLECYVLSNGQRIFTAESLERFFS